MSDKFKDSSEDLKRYAELKVYSDAQYRTILELNKKINALEQENISLKRAASAANAEQKTDILSKASDEQTICETQLAILRDRALDGELTMEESRKADLFARLLITLRDPSRKKDDGLKGLDTKQLLKIVEGGLKDDGSDKHTS